MRKVLLTVVTALGLMTTTAQAANPGFDELSNLERGMYMMLIAHESCPGLEMSDSDLATWFEVYAAVNDMTEKRALIVGRIRALEYTDEVNQVSAMTELCAIVKQNR